jgi:hypothetical protein
MKLILKRIAKKELYTIGRLYIDNEYFCDTIEDTDRDLKEDMTLDEILKIKIQNKTAIPTGTYKVIVNVSPSKQRLLPRLLDVKGFDGILIHRGNTENDSSGCIIVGENKVVGKVINSTFYENKLVELLKNENDISITVE